MKHRVELITLALALTPGIALAETDSSDAFYGDWVSVTRYALKANGDPDLSFRVPASRETLTISRDGVQGGGFEELLHLTKKCRRVAFTHRMWSDFAYQRLAAYDIRSVFKAINLPYSYNSNRIYRINCADPEVDREINYYEYYDHGDRKSERIPPNQVLPYDNLNFVYITRSSFLMFDGSGWSLMERAGRRAR